MYPPPSPEGRIARIERGAVHDGPGVRTVLFLKGCPLRCVWCHSPETQSVVPQVLLYPDRCLACGACETTCPYHAAGPRFGPAGIDRAQCAVCGTCTDVCPTAARMLSGRPMSVDAVLAELLADRIFYDQSGGGVTLSGGEPLMQPRFTLALLERCRRERIHTAIETCGLAETCTLLKAARLTDLFLFDLKIADDERHRRVTGRSNRRILANLAALAAVHPQVRARIPIVPGINDDTDNLEALGTLLAQARIGGVDILPYHRAGVAKYERLGRPYPLRDIEPPSAEALDASARTLRAHGLAVHIGGI